MSGEGATWQYEYDINGMRSKRTNGNVTHRYIYNCSQLSCLQISNAGTMYFTYDDRGRPFTVNFNGVTYSYVLNLQGDVVAITDATGKSVVDYSYDAWGKTSGRQNSAEGLALLRYNPLRYRGYVYDTETGLYYLQSRYYNPEIGRFINADAFASTGQGALGNNMYAYCLNNPVMGYDPLGRFGLTALICGAIIISGSTLVGGLLGAFSAATTDGNVVESAIEGAITGAIGATFGLLAPEIGIAMAFGGAAVFAFATDITIQAHFSESGPANFTLEDIDAGRAVDVALQTGIGTLVPSIGGPLENTVDAIGTTVLWAEYSSLVASVDVILTNIWEQAKDRLSDASESICVWP